MTHDQALIPQLISKNGHRVLHNVSAILGGTFLLALLAQVTIRVPGTPVPITGQTFGIALIALTWGRKRALAVILTYLSAGALGLPIFAMGKSGLVFGPTVGYLIGMIFSSYLMGFLADLGWTKKFLTTWLATCIGSLVTFSFGVLVLSYFVPSEAVFAAGVLLFLPGDALKTLAASSIAYQIHKKMSLSR